MKISPPLKAIASFFLLEWLVSFPAKVSMATGIMKWGQWNWAWPACLILGCAIAVHIWRPLFLPHDRHARKVVPIFVVYLLALLLYCLKAGLPAPVLFSVLVLNTFIFQLIVSIGEEYFYRRIGIEYISAREKFRFPLCAIFVTSGVFGLAHGLNPLWLGNGGFGWTRFFGTLLMGVILGFIYWKTRSITLVSLLHFIVNTGGVFLVPTSKLIQDLSSVGHIVQ